MFVIVISVWTTTVFVMTVESDYSVKSGALRPLQKITIVVVVVVMILSECRSKDLVIQIIIYEHK